MGQRGLRIILENEYEEVFRSDYRDLHQALRSLRRFLEKIYNEKRLHSALGYLPTSEFEANLATQHKEAAARHLTDCMSFLRDPEIYTSDEDASLADVPAHRLDEFPVGYSLAVCAPALPASASPTAPLSMR